MANPFDQFDAQPQQGGNPFDQFDAPAQKQQPNTLTDVVRSIPGGIAKGVSAIAGIPGDINAGVDWLMGLTPEQKAKRDSMSLIPGPPTSGQIADTIAAPFGGYYQPKTSAGHYAETIASFAPSAVSPGSAVKRIARAVVPGAASEAAGQATEGTDLESAARVAGAVAGGAGLGAIEKGAAAKSLPKTPTTKELFTAGRQSYNTAQASPLIVSGQAVQRTVQAIKSDLAGMAFHPGLQPKTAAVLGELEKVASQNHTLAGVETLRKLAGHAAGAVEKSDRMMGRVIKDHIDDLVNNLTPGDLVGAPDPAAISALKDARLNWARASKGEIIDGLIEKAKLNAPNFSASGYENSLRIQFRKLANNDRAMRRFSADEQQAIKRVAKGGIVENSLRQLGKFAPTGIVSTGIGAGIGASIGGPVGAVAVPAAGAAARQGAKALTSRNAKRASELVRRGGPAPVNPAKGAPTSEAALAAAVAAQQLPNRDMTYADRIRALTAAYPPQ
jgi:hypothetical protein